MKYRVYHKPTTVSTNLDARTGKPGDVFTADFQTAGRGRLDHKWLSAPGENLMLSAVLDVGGLFPEHVSTLPLAVGLAVLRGLSPFLTDAMNPVASPLALKWPNDILVGGKKICGILCERVGDNVIAGLGVNVRQTAFPSDVASRATSLAQLLLGQGRPAPAVAEVRDSILDALSDVYAAWRADGFAAIYPEIARHDFLRGESLGVIQTDDDAAPLRGLCGGIQSDGALLVGDTRVYAGEVHLMLGPGRHGGWKTVPEETR